MHVRLGALPSWQERVIRAVARLEGDAEPFEAQNRSSATTGDRQGLSFGVLQWTQRSGELGKVLSAMRKADTVTFDAVFGGPDQAARLLQVTNAGDEGTRLSLPLWAAPWTGYFTAAGRHPPFQAAQLAHAQTGYHWRIAEKLSSILGPRTWSVRAWAVFFDRAVQTPSRAVEEANALASKLGAGLASWSEWTLLDHFIEAVARRYDSDTYEDIRTRRGNALLTDPTLSDAPAVA
jgi:hypothetical protein